MTPTPTPRWRTPLALVTIVGSFAAAAHGLAAALSHHTAVTRARGDDAVALAQSRARAWPLRAAAVAYALDAQGVAATLSHADGKAWLSITMGESLASQHDALHAALPALTGACVASIEYEPPVGWQLRVGARNSAHTTRLPPQSE